MKENSEWRIRVSESWVLESCCKNELGVLEQLEGVSVGEYKECVMVDWYQGTHLAVLSKLVCRLSADRLESFPQSKFQDSISSKPISSWEYLVSEKVAISPLVRWCYTWTLLKSKILNITSTYFYIFQAHFQCNVIVWLQIVKSSSSFDCYILRSDLIERICVLLKKKIVSEAISAFSCIKPILIRDKDKE